MLEGFSHLLMFSICTSIILLLFLIKMAADEDKTLQDCSKPFMMIWKDKMIDAGGSLANVESVEAVFGLGVDPLASNGVYHGSDVSSGAADGAPGDSLSVDEAVSDVHGLVVIACASIANFSTLVVIDYAVDQILSFLSNSGTFIAITDEGILAGIGGSQELEEEVGPVGIDSVDAGEGGDQVFVGDPDEPAEPDGLCLDDNEEVLARSSKLLVHVLLDVLGVGLDVFLVEGAGGVSEVSKCGDVLIAHTGSGEIVELKGSPGCGKLSLLRLLDGHSCNDCDDGQKKVGCLHSICRLIIKSKKI